MKSKLFLTFDDRSLEREFITSKSKYWTFASLNIFLIRFGFAIITLIFYLEGNITLKRLILRIVGDTWHLLALMLAWRFPFIF